MPLSATEQNLMNMIALCIAGALDLVEHLLCESNAENAKAYIVICLSSHLHALDLVEPLHCESNRKNVEAYRCICFVITSACS